MTKKQALINEIEKLPDPIIEELLDFINYLKSRKLRQTYNTLLVSEPVLKKDWLKPEEDEAWKDL